MQSSSAVERSPHLHRDTSRRLETVAAIAYRVGSVGVTGLALDVAVKYLFESVYTLWSLAGSPSHLKGSSGKDLPIGVEVLLVFKERRNKNNRRCGNCS